MEALNRLGAIAVPGVTSYALDETPDTLGGAQLPALVSAPEWGGDWLSGGIRTAGGARGACVAGLAGRRGSRLADGAAGDGGGDRRVHRRAGRRSDARRGAGSSRAGAGDGRRGAVRRDRLSRGDLPARMDAAIGA